LIATIEGLKVIGDPRERPANKKFLVSLIGAQTFSNDQLNYKMDVADILPRNFTCLTSIIYGKYIKSREG